MRTVIDLAEIETYRICPEKERRRKMEPERGITEIERLYRFNLRRILIRLYSELASGRLLTEAEIRRAWSKCWDLPIQHVRNFSKAHQSYMYGVFTDNERMALRGVTALNKHLARPMLEKMTPVVVDENFTLDLGTVSITGSWDLIFQDKHDRFWIVDWSQSPRKYEVLHDLRHAVFIEAFSRQFGKSASVLVDYTLVVGNYIEPSPRNHEQVSQQLEEAAQIARAISLDVLYRSIGPACESCVFKRTCIGEKVIVAKQPRKPVKGKSVTSRASVSAAARK